MKTWAIAMVDKDKKDLKADGSKEVKLPCGCVYRDKGWMLMRINECDYHHHKRITKRPYRPKAECVRP